MGGGIVVNADGTASPGCSIRWRLPAALLAIFALALAPRLYGALNIGWDWDYPGSFSLVNFDEGGSCRAALGGFEYSTFIGRQTIAIATALGDAPPASVVGDHAAVKSWCHSAGHIRVARVYSAVTGALTAGLLAVMGLMLRPSTPAVGYSAGVLLAISGFHISESHSGTVDVPSVFFVYLLLTALVAALRYQRKCWLWLSPLMLLAAVWAKYWLFAIFAYLALLPLRWWHYLGNGWTRTRLVLAALSLGLLVSAATNADVSAPWWLALCGLCYAPVPWRRLRLPMAVAWALLPLALLALTRLDLVQAWTTGSIEGRFGAGYGAIGWHKWPRNLLNVPLVLGLGLGIPACLFLPAGVAVVLRDRHWRAWLCLLPVALFGAYMALLAPVTYYRHYLALIPAAALLAACGFWNSRYCRRPALLILFFAWPALLAVDMELDYYQDPRIQLRSWYAANKPERVLMSYYVNPPVASGAQHRIFTPEYAQGNASALRQAQYLILSENWFDTAFANELNGPLVNDLQRLPKTRPAYARFYRQVIAGEHPLLRAEHSVPIHNFMPELLLHRYFYGTFQMFVGDIRIFTIVPSGAESAALR